MTLFKVTLALAAPVIGTGAAMALWYVLMVHAVTPIAAALQALANTL